MLFIIIVCRLLDNENETETKIKTYGLALSEQVMTFFEKRDVTRNCLLLTNGSLTPQITPAKLFKELSSLLELCNYAKSRRNCVFQRKRSPMK